jgi:NAD(P)-dependent dehydrogenase (short-subunit alcohol dehydrogenase family)
MSRRTDEQVTALRGWTAEQAELYALSNTPAGRFTSCAEVAEAVEWALSAPRYVNGAVLEVMGGV